MNFPALVLGRKALALGAILAIASQVGRADPIPYPTSGTLNPVTYSFTAAASGDIIAYFAGSGASYDEQLGMLINGVMSPKGFGLDDHTSAIGQSFNLGTVTAGDSLIFVINVISPALGLVYSDPSMNGAYDGGVGTNHIYSTPYTATSPIYPGIPVGTYVGFEDLPFKSSDLNYFDETYVFTNVATTTRGVPDGTPSILLVSLAFAGLGFLRRRLHA